MPFSPRRRSKGHKSGLFESIRRARRNRKVRQHLSTPRRRPKFRKPASAFSRARLKRGLQRRRYSLKARTRIITGALRSVRKGGP